MFLFQNKSRTKFRNFIFHKKQMQASPFPQRETKAKKGKDMFLYFISEYGSHLFQIGSGVDSAPWCARLECIPTELTTLLTLATLVHSNKQKWHINCD